MSGDIAAFIEARFAEREQAARAAGGKRWLWRPSHPHEITAPLGDGHAVRLDATMSVLRAHIALNDPAYVLADVAAKRAILAEHGDSDYPYDPEGSAHGNYSWTPHCTGCGEADPCKTKRLLAAPYADHPDYDPAWRPA